MIMLQRLLKKFGKFGNGAIDVVAGLRQSSSDLPLVQVIHALRGRRKRSLIDVENCFDKSLASRPQEVYPVNVVAKDLWHDRCGKDAEAAALVAIHVRGFSVLNVLFQLFHQRVEPRSKADSTAVVLESLGLYVVGALPPRHVNSRCNCYKRKNGLNPSCLSLGLKRAERYPAAIHVAPLLVGPPRFLVLAGTGNEAMQRGR